MKPRPPFLAAGGLALILALPSLAQAALTAAAPETLSFTPDRPAADTLVFTPSPSDSAFEAEPELTLEEDEWLRAPFGEDLLTEAGPWEAEGTRPGRSEFVADYNRVDLMRPGIRLQLQQPESMYPRLGGRIDYAFGRQRTLYGIQIEQPLAPHNILAVGASMVRRTDHSELHQVDDLENSLALLFGRQDYRDYFEREGFGAYVALRVPGYSTASAHVRSDRYRSLLEDPDTRSLFYQERGLRPNPAIDEGESHALLLRLERLAHRTRRMRAGLYHWIEVERSGGPLGGDFDYTRALADVRSVLRLSPATTLALRAVGGSTLDGVLPRQKAFTAGGVDGLRAHRFGEFQGDQLALGQAEYSIGLWRMRPSSWGGGLVAIAFADAGTAWTNPGHEWDPDRQHFAADGGFGVGTSEDDLRLYFAKNLQEPGSDFLVSLRLRRPF